MNSGTVGDEAEMSAIAEWLLVGQAPKVPSLGLPHDITIIRSVSDAEFEEINNASRLIRSFGKNWGWNKIHTKVAGFFESLESARTAYIDTKVVNRSYTRRLDETFRSIVGLVRSWIDERGRSGLPLPPEMPACESISRIDLGTTPTISLVPGPSLPPVLLPLLSEELANQINPSVGGPLRVDAILTAIHREAETLAAHLLVAQEDDLKDAAELIARVSAEAITDIPALVKSDQLQPTGDTSESPRQISLRPIPTSDMRPIISALRMAKHLVQQGEPSEPIDRLNQPEGPPSGTAEGASESSNRASSSPEDLEEEVSNPPSVDVSALINKASTLSGDVERLWSAALDTSEKWNVELFQQWASVIHDLHAAMAQRGTRIRAHGLDTTVSTFPLSRGDMLRLDVHAGGQQLVAQLAVAELYVLRDLLLAMEALRRPTGFAVHLASGREQSWWESGAFGLLQLRAKPAMNVVAEFDLVTRGESVGAAPLDHGWIGEANLAGLCLSYGFVEASLLHSLRALKKGLNGDESFLSRIDVDDQISQDDVDRLAVIVDELISGKALSNGILIPLSHYWVEKFGRLLKALFAYRSLDAQQQSGSDAL